MRPLTSFQERAEQSESIAIAKAAGRDPSLALLKTLEIQRRSRADAERLNGRPERSETDRLFDLPARDDGAHDYPVSTFRETDDAPAESTFHERIRGAAAELKAAGELAGLAGRSILRDALAELRAADAAGVVDSLTWHNLGRIVDRIEAGR